jgi:hypothetical protein
LSETSLVWTDSLEEGVAKAIASAKSR